MVLFQILSSVFSNLNFCRTKKLQPKSGKVQLLFWDLKEIPLNNIPQTAGCITVGNNLKFAAKNAPGHVFLSVADKDRWETQKKHLTARQRLLIQRCSYFDGVTKRASNKIKSTKFEFYLKRPSSKTKDLCRPGEDPQAPVVWWDFPCWAPPWWLLVFSLTLQSLESCVRMLTETWGCCKELNQCS